MVYQPGTLEVVAYRTGKDGPETSVKTTGEPAQLLLTVGSAEHPGRRPGSRVHHRRALADTEGLTVPRSHNLVDFEIEGPGEIVAVGNGDAASHEPFQARKRRAFNGLCQVIVKGRQDSPGDRGEGPSGAQKG